MMQLRAPATTPLGTMRNLYVLSPTLTVCPALAPPPKRAAISGREEAKKSTMRPLPSSPHCTPMTRVTGKPMLLFGG
jgi:hypothetical protein